MEENMWFLTVFSINVSLMCAQTGFALTGHNEVGGVLEVKFGWSKQAAQTNNMLISSSAIVGMIIGSLVSGKLVQKDRRRASIWLSLTAIIGCVVSLYLNMVVICIGRCMFGFAAGALVTCGNLMLAETIPSSKFDSFSIMINVGIMGGLMLCLLIGSPLPSLDATSAATTKLWMIPYGFPIVIALFNIILFLTYITEDSLKNLVKCDKELEATNLIKKIYLNEDASYIFKNLKQPSE